MRNSGAGLALSAFVAGMMFDALMRTEGGARAIYAALFLANAAFMVRHLLTVKP